MTPAAAWPPASTHDRFASASPAQLALAPSSLWTSLDTPVPADLEGFKLSLTCTMEGPPTCPTQGALRSDG